MGPGLPRHHLTPGRPPVRTVGLVAALLILLIPLPGRTQSEDEVDVEQLELGRDIYLEECSGCHQPGGEGIPGSFPPLVGNPNVEDADYVREVVANGRSGVIEVNGQTYDGVMPPITTLDDEQVEAVIAFIQAGLVVPGETPDQEAAGPGAATELPLFATAMAGLAYLLALGIAALVMGPRIFGVIDRKNLAPLDAILKGGLIVVYFVLGTVILPSFVLQTDVVGRLPQGVQDVVAGSLWIGALAIGILGLWWFQRQDRI